MQRSYWGLFWTQFFGALNDNFFKNALVILITFKSVSLWGLSTNQIVAMTGGLFIMPFFFLSPLAGQLADKFQKTTQVRLIKWAELIIMTLAAIGFYFHLYGFLMFVLFCMGLHSTFFGPIKYSIIPDLTAEKDLVKGNAYIEVGTFLAILVGTIGGGLVVSTDWGMWALIGGLIGISLIGLISSYTVKNVPIADPNLKIKFNPFPEMIRLWKITAKAKAVSNSVVGISWFWFFGAAVLSLLPVYTKDVLYSGEQVVTLFLATFTIGIAVGSVFCEKLSFERVEIGLVPFGSLGMTGFLIDLAFASSAWPLHSAEPLLTFAQFWPMNGSLRILIDLFGVAFFGGLFTVPLYTLIQQRSDREVRSRIVAANNIQNSLFMVVASIMLMWFYAIKLTIPQMFLIIAIINLLVSIYIYSIVPEFTLRFLSWILARCVYRIRVTGQNHIPHEGAALLVCNHVTYIDWLILMAGIKRPIRFVMHYKFARIPLARYLFRHAGVIPIAGQTENPHIFEKAFLTVSKELRDGNLVCIFPEGTLTKTGEMAPFKRGVEHILSKDPVPVIPMSLDGLWGSIFSHKDKPAFKKAPKKIWFRVWITIGEAISPKEATAQKLENRVRELLN